MKGRGRENDIMNYSWRLGPEPITSSTMSDKYLPGEKTTVFGLEGAPSKTSKEGEAPLVDKHDISTMPTTDDDDDEKERCLRFNVIQTAFY